MHTCPDDELRAPACSRAFGANGPRLRPAIAQEEVVAAIAAWGERSESICSQLAALPQSGRGLPRVQCARFSLAGVFRCGAVSRTHLQRTLCMCVKIAARVRVWRAAGIPGRRIEMLDQAWFMRSLMAKIRTAEVPGCASMLR